MKVIGFSTRRYEGVTRKIIGRGADLLVCPPTVNHSFEEENLLTGYGVAVFNLHGYPNISGWFGDEGELALHADTLRELDLKGQGAAAVNCWLGDDGSPMRQALWEAGVDWVLAGRGTNYGGVRSMAGADVLIMHFLRALPGNTPEDALVRAKTLTRLTAPRWTADQRLALADALQFELLRR